MRLDELVEVLHRINKQQGTPAGEATLDQIIALVVKHPLDEDRGLCQERIMTIISQRVR